MAQAPERAFQPFKHFELRGWRNVAERYDSAFGSATGQAIGPMLDAARIGPGVRVLDVACGPGYVAAAAAAQGASVLGLDFAAEMVALAGRKWPGIEFREGDAENLDLPDASFGGEGATFDAVVMNFGILHLADPDRALAEAWRVLKPGGRLAFTVWEPPPRTVPFEIVLGAVKAWGVPDIGVPPGPPMFRFADQEEARRVLTGIGFQGVAFVHLPIMLALARPGDLFTIMLDAGVRTSGLLKAQTAVALNKIREHMQAKVAAYAIGDEADARYVLPMPAVLITAAKTAR